MSGAWFAAFGGVAAALALADGACAAAPGLRRVASRRRSTTRPGANGGDGVLRVGSGRDRRLGRRGEATTARRRDMARELLERHGVRTPAGLGARLAAAGISHAGAAEQAMALKCAGAAGVALVALPLALATSGGGALLLLGGLPAAAFLVPDWIVARRARARARLLSAQAPELLERVRLGAEAGLGPWRALALAVGRADGLLAEELRAALRAIDLGLPADQALRSLCARCPLPEVRTLAAALRRSTLHGSPLAPAVARLAASSRAERARRMHERAQAAAPKIQLVVALLLVPAALLLIAAALLTGLR